MRLIKKQPAFILLLLSCVLLAISCGGREAGDPVLTQPATGGQVDLANIPGVDQEQIDGESFPGELRLREAWKGDLKGMVRRRYIRALVVQSKTFYFFDKGQAHGITYEGLREFENVLNKQLRLRPARQVHVLFIPVSRDKLLSGLAEGLGDIAAANLTITAERRKQVDFTTPIKTGVKEIVVTGPRSPKINQVRDLSGQEVYVRRSSSYYESLHKLNQQFRAQGISPVKIREAEENLEDEDILEMVNAGLVGITVIDNHKAGLWASIFTGIKLNNRAAIGESGEIAWAFRKNSPQLRKALNGFVKTHKEGTLFAGVLTKRYFQDTKWIKNATSEQEIAKMRSIVNLFQKYAKQYDFDWLMVAAQAYQESGLDPSAKSRVGAVGIMQVMPRVAESPPISIKQVQRLENNVHAGVKILRHYRDTYFNEPQLDDFNRTLLCFAAYNAGPTRISTLRKRAARQGLNPNVWFGNVELVVAKSVGREPVRYVSNVMKYYVAYKLAREAPQRSATRRLPADPGFRETPGT